MKTLTIYLNSLFSTVFKSAIFITTLYFSTLFFLISIFEETLFGKISESHKTLMAEFMQKLTDLGEPAADNQSNAGSKAQSLQS